MADQSFEKLRKKNTEELRELAKGLEGEGIPGFANLGRSELLLALCKALGVREDETKHVKLADSKAIKARIQELKAERSGALESKDGVALKRVRRKIHKLKHQLRAASL